MVPDDGNIECGGFVDLQKASDTLNHQVLPAKVNKYGIFRASSDLLKRFIMTLILLL